MYERRYILKIQETRKEIWANICKWPHQESLRGCYASIKNESRRSWNHIYWWIHNEHRHSSFRGWCVRVHIGYIRQPIESFNMSFVWAISTRRHYGLFGINGVNNSQIVKLNIQELFIERNKEKGIRSQPFVLVLDNSSVHVSEISQSFYKSTKISVLTIPKYSPFLNTAEKLIGSIKKNIEKLQGKVSNLFYILLYYRQINVRSVACAFDEACKTDKIKYTNLIFKEKLTVLTKLIY